MTDLVLLANIDRPDSHTLAAYEATGGYRAWRRALRELSSQEVQDQVKSSGLRGRGGAGFPDGTEMVIPGQGSPRPGLFLP